MATKRKPQIKGLYYITHIANLPSILEEGILSHQLVEERNLLPTLIYDHQIISRRQHREVVDGKSLWYFANVYFQPRNPMLYRVIHQVDKAQVAIIEVNRKILQQPNILISTGNAASGPSSILSAKEGLDAISEMWDTLQSEYWKEEDGSKRRIMAECLVPERIPPELIQTVYVANSKGAEIAKSLLFPKSTLSIVPEPKMFFQPTKSVKVASKLFLVDGDMFFSQMNTFTISVNTVGVMGKGLASRTKYQFPDVYVRYQDVCKDKSMEIGKPYLYKREISIENQLADIPLSVNNGNKWFLLFPTKSHWKENSKIEEIEQGLQWIVNHWRSEGIDSLAVPALGCGLGGLPWSEVGPLMCRYLSQLDINVAIYLPREQEIPNEQLTPEFLLKKTS